jgi:hypothetical protein
MNQVQLGICVYPVILPEVLGLTPNRSLETVPELRRRTNKRKIRAIHTWSTDSRDKAEK